MVGFVIGISKSLAKGPLSIKGFFNKYLGKISQYYDINNLTEVLKLYILPTSFESVRIRIFVDKNLIKIFPESVGFV